MKRPRRLAIDKNTFRTHAKALASISKKIIIHATERGDTEMFATAGQDGSIIMHARVLGTGRSAEPVTVAVDAEEFDYATKAAYTRAKKIYRLDVKPERVKIITDTISLTVQAAFAQRPAIPQHDIDGEANTFAVAAMAKFAKAARAVGLGDTWMLIGGRFGLMVAAKRGQALIGYQAIEHSGDEVAISMADALVVSSWGKKLDLHKFSAYSLGGGGWVCFSAACGMSVFITAARHTFGAKELAKLVAGKEQPAAESAIIDGFRVTNSIEWHNKDYATIAIDDAGLVFNEVPLPCYSTGQTKTAVINAANVARLLKHLGESKLDVRVDANGRRVYLYHDASKIELITESEQK